MKKTVDFSKLVLTKKAEPKVEQKVVVVKFLYPSSQNYRLLEREVQLISLDDKYVAGLEYAACPKDGKRWKFKKYLRSRIPRGEIVTTYYGKPF